VDAPTVEEAVKLVEQAYAANFKTLRHGAEKEAPLRGRKRELWNELNLEERWRSPSPEMDPGTKLASGRESFS
jgi:hypothetical protein